MAPTAPNTAAAAPNARGLLPNQRMAAITRDLRNEVQELEARLGERLIEQAIRRNVALQEQSTRLEIALQEQSARLETGYKPHVQATLHEMMVGLFVL